MRIKPGRRPPTSARWQQLRRGRHGPVDNPVDEGHTWARSRTQFMLAGIQHCRETNAEAPEARPLPRSLSEIAPLPSVRAGTVGGHVSSEKVSRETTRTSAFRSFRARLRW
jgi:hypothetical protein